MFKAPMYLFWVILTLSHLFADVCSIQRQIVFYNELEISNASFWVGSTNSVPSIEHIPELLSSGAMKVCHEGVFVMYAEAGYQGDYTDIYNSGCSTIRTKRSFRALSSNDTSIPTISLGESPYFQGELTQYTADVPNYDGNFLSIAVTVTGEVTLYTLPKYGGLSICLKPFVFGTHYTWNTSLLGIESDSIKSFKFGCDSKQVFYSSNSSMSNSL